MSEQGPVDRLVLQFGNLRITVESTSAEERAQDREAVAPGSQAEAGPLAGSPTGTAPRADDQAFLTAFSARELGALNRPSCSYWWASRLRQLDS